MSLGPKNRFDKLRPEQAVGEHADSRERDRKLEERWTYERDGTMTTLAYVSAYSYELVPQFMDWYALAENADLSKEQAVTEWESVRFGSALDRAAHGILLFAVLNAFFPHRHKTKWTPKPEPAPPLTPKQSGALKSFPPGRLTPKQLEARLAQLDRQKGEIIE